MPELPEVETVVRLIRPKIVHRKIGKARFAVPRQLLPQTPRSVAQAVRNQQIREVRRRGKFILLDLEKGVLLIHLRMTGGLFVRPAESPARDYERAWFELDDGQDVLVFRDSRTLGVIQYYRSTELIKPIQNLGWEPLEKTIDVQSLRAALARRRIAIKPLLLDQRLWAGIGNIYASEVLWEARIDPRKRADRLTNAQLERLMAAVPFVLRRALERGGSTLRNFADPDGQPGSYQREFRVYNREGELCLRCGKHIVRIVQAKRSTYFCRSCQKI